MTRFGLICGWLLGPLALLAALLVAARMAPEPQGRFHGADVAVIGSSLTAYAVPESGLGLLGSGVRHWRVGIALPAEAQLLGLLDSAVAERPGLIVLEANALVTRLAIDPRHAACTAPAAGLRHRVKQAQLSAVDALRHLFGARRSLEGMGEPVWLDRPQVIDQALIKASYPLTVHPPCDEPRLRRAAERARAQGTKVVLIAPPRAPAAARWLDPVQAEAARAEAQALAARLGVALFEPAGPWRDAVFTDHAHLNRQGRAQFVAALRQWLGQQQ